MLCVDTVTNLFSWGEYIGYNREDSVLNLLQNTLILTATRQYKQIAKRRHAVIYKYLIRFKTFRAQRSYSFEGNLYLTLLHNVQIHPSSISFTRQSLQTFSSHLGQYAPLFKIKPKYVWHLAQYFSFFDSSSSSGRPFSFRSSNSFLNELNLTKKTRTMLTSLKNSNNPLGF
jgi:hypothetical protein